MSTPNDHPRVEEPEYALLDYGLRVSARVIEIRGDGVAVAVDGKTGFIPNAELSDTQQFRGDHPLKIDQLIEVFTYEDDRVDEQTHGTPCSIRRAASQWHRRASSAFSIGDIVNATVAGVYDDGICLDLGIANCWVFRDDALLAPGFKPKQRPSLGVVVKVEISRWNSAFASYQGSVRKADDGWTERFKELYVGRKIKGVISNITPEGRIFIDCGPVSAPLKTESGYLHENNMFSAGADIEVVVHSVHFDARYIGIHLPSVPTKGLTPKIQTLAESASGLISGVITNVAKRAISFRSEDSKIMRIRYEHLGLQRLELPEDRFRAGDYIAATSVSLERERLLVDHIPSAEPRPQPWEIADLIKERERVFADIKIGSTIEVSVVRVTPNTIYLQLGPLHATISRKQLGLERGSLRRKFTVGDPILVMLLWINTDQLEFGAVHVRQENASFVDAMISQGESQTIEFKSTLRINLDTGQRDKRIGAAVVKTIAGFLNSLGGQLIIGVADDGAPVGIGADGFTSEDKMNQHLMNLITGKLGSNIWASIRVSFDNYRGVRILVVRCEPSSVPVYAKENGDEKFYVRGSAGTKALSISEAMKYVRTHTLFEVPRSSA